MKQRKITKKERKAKRAAARQQREIEAGEPLVTVRTVGQDITLDEVIALFAGTSSCDCEWGSVGFDDQAVDVDPEEDG